MKRINLCLILLYCLKAFGEEDEITKLLQRISFMHEETQNYEQIAEQLQDLIDHPIDLRNATAEDLEELRILSSIQIQAILNYCSHQKLISIYELQTLPEIDLPTLGLILPFLTLSPINDLRSGFGLKPSHYLLVRYDQPMNRKSGFFSRDSLPPFAGKSGRVIVRYRLSYPGKLSIGLNMEKDAGEYLTWDPKRGKFFADYVNFHIMYMGNKRIKKLLIGDYRIQFGQGLILGGAGFSLGKGSDVILGIKRNDIGLKPHSSVTEFGFFRGIASTIALNDLKANFFLSHQKRDAGIIEENGDRLYNLRNTGLHRTQNELEGQNRISETVVGFNSSYPWKSFYEIGVNYIHTIYSHPVGKSTTIYNQFAVKGKEQSNLSLYFDAVYKNINFFSEIAVDLHSSSMAWVLGSLWSLSKRFELSLHWRNYPNSFNSIYGNAFSEKSGQQNETGFYMGIQCKISKRNLLTIYADQFNFPWLRFQQSSPSDGSEIGLSWQIQTSDQSTITLRYRQKLLPQDKSISTYLKQTSKTNNRQLRLSISKQSSNWLILKWHLQASRTFIESVSENGFLIAQDIQLNPMKNIRLIARFSHFDTFSFNTRQYIYENELLYGFSIPSFSGTGIRMFLLTRINMTRKWKLWLKYSLTYYSDRNFIGSGYDRIEGNQKADLKLQLLYKL